MTIDLRTSYSRDAFDDPDLLVQRARDALNDVDYDTMVCMGSSGATVVPYIARILDKHFAIVRKPSENSHDFGSINGMIGKRWIFVDDFVSTGSTLRRVKEAMDRVAAAHGEEEIEYVGAYLYCDHSTDGPKFRLPGTEKRGV